jgi:hypothetical protein
VLKTDRRPDKLILKHHANIRSDLGRENDANVIFANVNFNTCFTQGHHSRVIGVDAPSIFSIELRT